MKRLPVICFALIVSILFTSCGNFSSADSYADNVYSKPVALTRSNVGESSSTTESTAETTAESEVTEINVSSEPTETEITESETTEIDMVEPETTEIEPEIVVDESPAEDLNGLQFVVTANGKKFHKDSCRTVKSVKQYISFDEAVNLGYEACKICNPTVIE